MVFGGKVYNDRIETMVNEFSHLSPKAKEFINLSDNERISRIQGERWVGYTRAHEALTKMEELFNYPPKSRMPNLLLIGNTNNGKTSIIQHFYKKHPVSEENDQHYCPVLLFQMPSVPDEKRIYNAILERLGVPFGITTHPDRKKNQAFDVIKGLGVKIIIIDEIHHINAANYRKQRESLNTIKYIGNELKISIVAAGIQDAYRTFQNDPQLSNRFEPLDLPNWELGDEYNKLLGTLEKMLPLKKPSNLVEYDLAMKILSKSEGTIGEITKIIENSAILAINKKIECITPKIVDSIKYLSPSERKWKR